ncbi:MAG: DUF4157 domain-containing protein [Cyclobacteriaceae bacterium]
MVYKIKQRLVSPVRRNSPNNKKTGRDIHSTHNVYPFDISNISVSGNKEFIQPKLKISKPGDRLEREADQMADRVMQNGIEFNSESMSKESVEHSSIQAKPINRGISMPPSFEHHLHKSTSGGMRLPRATNRFMSRSFGVDFSHVRIHTDENAHKLNEAIHARAFTHGSDIYMNQGQYAPATPKGGKLLAHELTHVVQQDNNRVKNAIMRKDDGPEAAAEEEGRRFRSGRRADLGRIIRGMPESRVQLMTLLARVRSRAMGNPACARFFQRTFGFGPERVLDLRRAPTVMIDPELPISGRTRCPSPSVRLQPAICTSRLQDRVIMHELTHYAGCLASGRPTNEETARNGEDACIGTVAQELERHRQRAREQSSDTK